MAMAVGADLVEKVNLSMELMLVAKLTMNVTMRLSHLAQAFFHAHHTLVSTVGMLIPKLFFLTAKTRQTHVLIAFVNVIVLLLNVTNEILIHSISH